MAIKIPPHLLMPDIQLNPEQARPYLPKAYRVIPIGSLLVFAVGFATALFFFNRAQGYRTQAAAVDKQANGFNGQAVDLRGKRVALHNQIQNAMRIRSWLESARPLAQPMVEYFNQLPREIVIDSFSVRRDEGSPVLTFDVFINGERQEISREFLHLQTFLRANGYEPIDPRAEAGNRPDNYHFLVRMRAPLSPTQ